MLSLNTPAQRSILRSMVLFLALIFLFPLPLKADEPDKFNAAILVSRHIKPYMDALRGLRGSLDRESGIDEKVFILDQYDLDHPRLISKELSGLSPDIMVAVGPEATTLAWSLSRDTGVPSIYSMVLNPEALAAVDIEPGCGLSMKIPVARQIRDMAQVLDGMKRLGILYDPSLNQAFVNEAARQAGFSGLEVVPLQVSSSRQIPGVLEEKWPSIDALWLIPDQTVISQTLVEYIIREALFQKKPVVGYNRFFYDSGAALAFALDFEDIGRQTAKLVIDHLSGLSCTELIPSYQVLVNHRVMRRMGLTDSGAGP